VPVLCGAAIKNIGSVPFLDMIVDYMPSPLDRGSATGVIPGSDNEEERAPEESAPFSAMVFKTIADPYAGKLTLFRVFSGKIKSRQKNLFPEI